VGAVHVPLPTPGEAWTIKGSGTDGVTGAAALSHGGDMQDPSTLDIFDIFDIVIVVLGTLVGMGVTIMIDMDPTTDWVDYVIMACAMAPLLLRRAVLPTTKRPPHPSMAARLAYMFTGILGTLGLAAGVAVLWSGLQDGSSRLLALREASLPGLLGGGLLSVAIVLDWIRPAPETD